MIVAKASAEVDDHQVVPTLRQSDMAAELPGTSELPAGDRATWLPLSCLRGRGGTGRNIDAAVDSLYHATLSIGLKLSRSFWRKAADT